MEIRNNTPSFGMAFIMPDKKTMKVLERFVEPRSFEAFVKEQAKCKYFDIETTLDKGIGHQELVPTFRIVPKEGVDTFDYGHERPFHIEGRFQDYKARLASDYLNTFSSCYKAGDDNLKSKIGRKLAGFLYKLDLRDIEKNHPERMVTPALRAAGDKALALDASVEEANKIFRIAQDQ